MPKRGTMLNFPSPFFRVPNEFVSSIVIHTHSCLKMMKFKNVGMRGSAKSLVYFISAIFNDFNIQAGVDPEYVQDNAPNDSDEDSNDSDDEDEEENENEDTPSEYSEIGQRCGIRRYK